MASGSSSVAGGSLRPGPAAREPLPDPSVLTQETRVVSPESESALRLFDSHCHLQDEAFDVDRADALMRAWQAGVREIVAIASEPEDSARARRLAESSGEEE